MTQFYSRVLETHKGKLYVYPETWNAGNLQEFAPKGTGVYGLQQMGYPDPMKSAPPHEAEGGIVFFDSRFNVEDFQGLLRLFQIYGGSKDYALFTATSKNPMEEKYLCQFRIVTKFGLRFLYHDLMEKDYGAFPEQDLTIEDCLLYFLEEQAQKYNKGNLEGLFGGDGDYAYEKLCFGFMLENAYHSVYRIWSRAWLVTK